MTGRRRRTRIGAGVAPGALALATGVVAGAAAVALTAALPARAPAQVLLSPGDSTGETRLLRAASAREAVGDLPGAERILRKLLEADPTSGNGIVALERVLRSRGELREILPVLERFIEADPGSTLARFLQLRTLGDLGDSEGLRSAAEAWIAAEPGSPEAYREIARVYGNVRGPDAALSVLDRGREALDDPGALGVERGRALAEAGRIDEAARAWAGAAGSSGWAPHDVARRIREIPGDPEPLVRRLVGRLLTEPTTPGRRRTAAYAAALAGLGDDGRRIARELVPEMGDDAAAAFLTQLAHRADDGGAPDLVLWSWLRLRERGDREDEEALSLDRRIAASALAVGDTAAARDAYRRIAGRLPPGASERRRALGASIRLGVGRVPVEELREALAAFRDEFPEAPEADALAAGVAHALHRSGEPGSAAALLEGVDGHRAEVERAYLALERGAVDTAATGLTRGVAALPPDEGTRTLAWLRLLRRLTGDARLRAGEAALAAHHGDAPGALAALEDVVDLTRDDARARVLAMAARWAARSGRPERARAHRRRIAEEHSGAGAAPDAILELARGLAREPGGAEEAAELLEMLILEHPESAVVPQARRLLERVRERVPGSAGG